METLPHSQIDRQQVIDRLAKLDSARAQLKKEFIGIDRVIDELMDSISTWYTLPELQTRPLVVNLWGMTGTGKTSLIRRVAELLEQVKATHVLDMGNSNDSRDFFNTMDDIFKHNNARPFILMLDEFQHARTINEKGEERAFGRMGLIWKLLDSGVFDLYSYLDSPISVVHDNIDRLQWCLDRGVAVEKGMVKKGMEIFLEVMSRNVGMRGFPDTLDLSAEEFRKLEGKTSFYPAVDLGEIRELTLTRFTSDAAVKRHLMTLNGSQTIAFLKEVVEVGRTPRICDCSKSLVIVAGNLDEAYQMSSDMSPDIPAEVWKKLVKDIGINEVKTALTKRFRAEHIGRLGNNHIIYPAIGDKEFKAFIEMSLLRIRSEFQKSHGIKLHFTRAISNIIYHEGVFPTQGFRPVISTIDQLVRSKLSVIVGHVLVSYPTTDEVSVSFSANRLRIKFTAKGVEVGEESQRLRLGLSERRKLKKDDDHALVAVHEAAHAVCGALLLNEVPEIAVSVTSTSSESGFVIRSGENGFVQRNRLLRIAAFMLAGYAGEKLIFGEEGLTNGSSSDLQKATAFVRSTLMRTGLGSVPVSYQAEKEFDRQTVVDSDGALDSMTVNYLKEAEGMAREVLEEERHLLLVMAKGLFNQGSLTKAEMQRMVDAHAVRNASERAVKLQYRETLLQEVAVLQPLQKVA